MAAVASTLSAPINAAIGMQRSDRYYVGIQRKRARRSAGNSLMNREQTSAAECRGVHGYAKPMLCQDVADGQNKHIQLRSVLKLFQKY